MTLAVAHRGPRSGVDEPPDYAPAVYGSLLVTTLVTVQWQGAANPELIGLSLLISVVAFWLTHVWSEIVAHRVHGPIDVPSAVAIARSEATMVTAVIVPGIILGLPRFLGVPVDVAIGAALLASLVQLFLWGLAVGLAAGGSRWLALGVALVDCGIGVGGRDPEGARHPLKRPTSRQRPGRRCDAPANTLASANRNRDAVRRRRGSGDVPRVEGLRASP